jgi:hypothetical protein
MGLAGQIQAGKELRFSCPELWNRLTVTKSEFIVLLLFDFQMIDRHVPISRSTA